MVSWSSQVEDLGRKPEDDETTICPPIWSVGHFTVNTQSAAGRNMVWELAQV